MLSRLKRLPMFAARYGTGTEGRSALPVWYQYGSSAGQARCRSEHTGKRSESVKTSTSGPRGDHSGDTTLACPRPIGAAWVYFSGWPSNGTPGHSSPTRSQAAGKAKGEGCSKVQGYRRLATRQFIVEGILAARR
jgi:hypothetical protein